MGLWSSIAKIGAIAGSAIAAPFTAGTSLSWLPAVIGAGSTALDLIGAHESSKASKEAAEIQSFSADKSNQLLDIATGDAEEHLRGGQKQAYESLYPYLALGEGATNQLSALMDPNSEFSQGFQGKFVAPNPQDVLNNPAIQFQLDMGQKAIERSASARGGLNSGATLKRVNEHAQGVAAQGYDDLYDRALAEFDRTFGIYKDTRDNRLSTVNLALQSAQDAANRVSGQALDVNNQLASNVLNVAGRKGDNLQGAANVNAAAKIAGANANANAYSNIGQRALDLFTIYAQNRGNPVVPGNNSNNNSNNSFPSVQNFMEDPRTKGIPLTAYQRG